MALRAHIFISHLSWPLRTYKVNRLQSIPFCLRAKASAKKDLGTITHHGLESIQCTKNMTAYNKHLIPLIPYK